MEESEPGEWKFDGFFNIYVMHNEKQVMYHDGQQWIHGDYDNFYTTATQTNSTHSIRFVVIQSGPFLEAGKVVLVDENGLTVGRDRSWDRRLRLPEMIVSKYHCMVFLNPTTHLFYLVDVGSQHGTSLNGERLSEPKKSSLPHQLHHLDRIEIGSTTLEVHLHQTGPCEECIAHEFIDVSSGKKEKKGKKVGMQELASNRRDWMQIYKQDYDISSTNMNNNEDYIDRAELRRKTKVNNTPMPERIAPSVRRMPSPPRTVQGVGNDMLKKLGWKEGQSLGKNQTGIKEPIELTVQKDRAGLGMKK